MRLVEIKELAAGKGVKAGKMTKTELVRAIQQAEGNPACFATGKAAECGEMTCLWREDCN